MDGVERGGYAVRSMRRWISLAVTLACLVALALFFRPGHEEKFSLPSVTFTLRSSVFQDQGAMPAAHTCDGADMHPPLVWEGLPEGATSLAFLVEDLDAPVAAGPYVHWLVWNVPASAASLHTDYLPGAAVEGVNSDGVSGWASICPPSGETHRYTFTAYALDDTLTLAAGADVLHVRRAMDGHVLAVGTLTGTYGR